MQIDRKRRAETTGGVGGGRRGRQRRRLLFVSRFLMCWREESGAVLFACNISLIYLLLFRRFVPALIAALLVKWSGKIVSQFALKSIPAGARWRQQRSRKGRKEPGGGPCQFRERRLEVAPVNSEKSSIGRICFIAFCRR